VGVFESFIRFSMRPLRFTVLPRTALWTP